jgi:hypothetical protein
MRIAELATMIGEHGELHTNEGLYVSVVVKDVRFTFGRTDVLVTPVDGRGDAWVSLERVGLYPTS